MIQKIIFILIVKSVKLLYNRINSKEEYFSAVIFLSQRKKKEKEKRHSKQYFSAMSFSASLFWCKDVFTKL